MRRIAASRVAVFGIGGVGGYVVEALARSGIGALDLIDSDAVDVTNLNRQIIATWDTIGRDKVEVAAERVKRISPDCVVRTHRTFYLPDTQDQFDFSQYDYIVDAIDTVTGKLAIVENAAKAGTPVISAMGAGNKIDASGFQVADIYETSVCPLAKVMRQECRRRGIRSLKVVYSKEKAIRPNPAPQESSGDVHRESPEKTSPDASRKDAGRDGYPRRSIPGSTAFAPSVVGLIIAGEIINDLSGLRPNYG